MTAVQSNFARESILPVAEIVFVHAAFNQFVSGSLEEFSLRFLLSREWAGERTEGTHQPQSWGGA